MGRLRCFVDFDFTVTAHVRPGHPEVGLARHADDLLRYLVARCEPIWLTTRRESVYAAFAELCADPELRALVCQIPVAQFETLKVKALPTDGRPWVWLDDQPLAYERNWLAERGLLDRWVRVNVRHKPDDCARDRNPRGPGRPSRTGCTPWPVG